MWNIEIKIQKPDINVTMVRDRNNKNKNLVENVLDIWGL